MAADMGAAVPPATYDLIGTWVGQQRQAPTPLTDKLRTALLGLEYALKSESVSLIEPELGEDNWVGLLQEYRAAYPFNGSRDVNFTDSAVDPTGRGPLRFKCEVVIGEEPGTTFPPADANQPTFARKKDAKKYAAKCAVEWLRTKGYMPQNGGARFPKGMLSAPQQMQRMQQMQQQAQTGRQQSNTTSSPGPARAQPPSSPPAKVPTSPFDDSQPSARSQVAELCGALGISIPNYKIEPAGDGFFGGWADFNNSSRPPPFDAAALTRVSDVLGEKATKEMVAEQLLKHLRAEKQKRDAANDAFLEQFMSGGSKSGDGKE